VLTRSERGRLVGKLEPESVSSAGVAVLGGDDAGESGSNHAARQRPLGHAAGPQIDISGRLVNAGVTGNGLVAHGTEQLLEGIGTGQSAEFPTSQTEI